MMPWTLYRYIFWDLCKLTVLAAAVLCTVVAIALAIRPLAEGLLEPLDLLRFVMYSMPTLVGFILPFAGAFAATLVFCRMTADNEVLAASVSGISYRGILVPVLVLGLLIGGGLWTMSNWVMPYFYRGAAALVQRDVASMLVRQIGRNEPVQMAGYVIYADRAVERETIPQRDEPHQPTQWMLLDGLVVGQFDRETGDLRSEYTAAEANLLFYDIDGEPWLTVQLRDAEMYRPARGEIAFGREVPLEWAIDRPFRDRPDFYTPRQLAEIEREPEKFSTVAERRRGLERAIATERLLEGMQRQLAQRTLRLHTGEPTPAPGVDLGPPAEAEEAAPDPAERGWLEARVDYLIRSPGIEREGSRLLLRGDEEQPVRIDQRREGSLERQWYADEAVLEVSRGMPGEEPRVEIRLVERVRVIDWPEGLQTRQRATILGSARWTESLLPRIRARSTEDLLDTAERDHRDGEAVAGAAAGLRRELRWLSLRIASLQHTRGALAMAGVLVLLLGAVLAMHGRHRTPLVVYLGSFLAALATIVLVNAGQSYAHNVEMEYALTLGLPLIWSGNIVLVVVIAAAYMRLSRH